MPANPKSTIASSNWLKPQGLVSMDSTLAELLGDSVVLAPSVQGVTLRQPVTHTSGFPRIPKPLGDKVTKMAAGVVVLSNQTNATEMLGMMLMRQARTQSWSLSAADLAE